MAQMQAVQIGYSTEVTSALGTALWQWRQVINSGGAYSGWR